MKRILSLILAVVMLVGCCAMFASCGGEEAPLLLTPVAKADIKFGLICLHDENSTYDKNFLDAAERTRVALGLTEDQLIIKTNIPEDDSCYDAAVELVEAGCQVIFANSFGHEDYIMKAAAEFPGVQFCHATGTKAHTSGLGNYHNAFASIYEGRFVAGMVAGMKLAEMLKAGLFEVNADDNTADVANEIFEGKIVDGKLTVGYVGAFPYAEVISGYTSWFLGVRMAFEAMTAMMDGDVPELQMKVEYTNSWYDEAKENEKALALINGGAVLLSQHADSMGAPRACEEKNIPNVSYNGSTAASCDDTFLVSSYIDWDPYYQLIINSVIAGIRIPEEYCGGFAEGSVKLTALNEKAGVVPEGAEEMIEEVIAEFKSGSFERMTMLLQAITGDENAKFTGVFDTDSFTVNEQKVTTYLANVHDDASFTGDTEVIIDGVFAESEFRAAPYFDLIIDGIIVPQS